MIKKKKNVVRLNHQWDGGEKSRAPEILSRVNIYLSKQQCCTNICQFINDRDTHVVFIINILLPSPKHALSSVIYLKKVTKYGRERIIVFVWIFPSTVYVHVCYYSGDDANHHYARQAMSKL